MKFMKMAAVIAVAFSLTSCLEKLPGDFILEEEGIPYLLKDRGSGEVVRILSGYSTFGSDIFVPAALLETATELLDAYRNGEVVEEEPEDGEEEDA